MKNKKLENLNCIVVAQKDGSKVHKWYEANIGSSLWIPGRAYVILKGKAVTFFETEERARVEYPGTILYNEFDFEEMVIPYISVKPKEGKAEFPKQHEEIKELFEDKDEIEAHRNIEKCAEKIMANHQEFTPCGQGDNTCNCKSAEECGYLTGGVVTDNMDTIKETKALQDVLKTGIAAVPEDKIKMDFKSVPKKFDFSNSEKSYPTPAVKPPLGLVPREMWQELRKADIIAAMKRFREANKEIPLEWIDELLDYEK